MENLVQRAATLLRRVVALPSFSKEEDAVCDLFMEYLTSNGIAPIRVKNNIIALPPNFDPSRATLMLNSHLDTVKPALGYTFDPFDSGSDHSIIRGLGSNDAGGAVVTMVESFLYFSQLSKINRLSDTLPFNLLLLLSAQEENSGADGISLALKHAPKIDAAIVGEPTQMKGAIGERGLIVLDCVAHGVSGHAAHKGGVNALYKAIEEIEKIRVFQFPETSATMGEIKMSVTQIEAGRAHNVIPDSCSFVVDIRTTDAYSNIEVVEMLSSHLNCTITPRNLKNRSSATPIDSPLLKALDECQIENYISPTTSDWMRIEAPAIKMGPGDSRRSHAPDEYITLEELKLGVSGYINFIKTLKL